MDNQTIYKPGRTHNHCPKISHRQQNSNNDNNKNNKNNNNNDNNNNNKMKQ